jgi:hypothetical protein
MSQSLLDFLGHQQAVALPAAFSKMRGFGWRELGEVRLCLRLAYLLLRRSGEGRSERLLTGADVVDPGFSGAAADFAGGLAFRIRGLGRPLCSTTNRSIANLAAYHGMVRVIFWRLCPPVEPRSGSYRCRWSRIQSETLSVG